MIYLHLQMCIETSAFARQICLEIVVTLMRRQLKYYSESSSWHVMKRINNLQQSDISESRINLLTVCNHFVSAGQIKEHQSSPLASLVDIDMMQNMHQKGGSINIRHRSLAKQYNANINAGDIVITYSAAGAKNIINVITGGWFLIFLMHTSPRTRTQQRNAPKFYKRITCVDCTSKKDLRAGGNLVNVRSKSKLFIFSQAIS